LLVRYYFSENAAFSDIAEILKRFDALSLTPRNTYRMGLIFWITRAYVFLTLYEKGNIELSLFKRALRDLQKTHRNSLVIPHHLVLNGHDARLDKNYPLARDFATRALQFGHDHQNIWAAVEAKKLLALIDVAEQKKNSALETIQSLINETEERKWQGFMPQLQELKSKMQ
jgi:hypothetical protein